MSKTVTTISILILAFFVVLLLVQNMANVSNFQQPESSYVMPAAKSVNVSDISHKADDIPVPITSTREENKRVEVDLNAVQLVAELDDGTTYEYWTFNKQVPGPFIRVMEGDTVEVSLTHSHDHVALNSEEDDLLHSFTVSALMPNAFAQEHEHSPETPDEHEHEMMDMDDMEDMMDQEMDMDDMDHEEMGMSAEEHAAAGHGEHSIDLHAVQGPGGGADLIRTAPDETLAFEFKATKPGIYIYHCGSPHVATHIANGMYGMILVEPKGGLPPVDKEFYVVQGEFYTKGEVGENGHQEYSLEKLLKEEPEYVVFNGRMGALTEEGALTAEVGDEIRLFFGVSGQLASNFHIIGEIMDKVYREGDMISPPARNIQTTLVPGGGAMMTEFTVDVPGTYLLVDHALSRALNRGALGKLIVTGEDQPDLYQKVEL